MSAQLATDIQSLCDRIRVMYNKIERCKGNFPCPPDVLMFPFAANAGNLYLQTQRLNQIQSALEGIVADSIIASAVLYDLGECDSVWRGNSAERVKCYLATQAGGWPVVKQPNARTNDLWLTRCNALLAKLETYWDDYSLDDCVDGDRACAPCTCPCGDWPGDDPSGFPCGGLNYSYTVTFRLLNDEPDCFQGINPGTSEITATLTARVNSCEWSGDVNDANGDNLFDIYLSLDGCEWKCMVGAGVCGDTAWKTTGATPVGSYPIFTACDPPNICLDYLTVTEAT